MKIKKGDTVKIVRGKDKGKTGVVEKVLPKEEKVVVANVNQYKRHRKASPTGQKSEIVTIVKPLALGAVTLICPKCKMVTRVGYRIEGGSKIRICRKCEESI